MDSGPLRQIFCMQGCHSSSFISSVPPLLPPLSILQNSGKAKALGALPAMAVLPLSNSIWQYQCVDIILVRFLPKNKCIQSRCKRVIANNIAYAKFRKSLLIWLGIRSGFAKFSKLSMCSAGAGRCWLVQWPGLPPWHCTWSVLKFL